jgi:hypothetical protein
LLIENPTSILFTLAFLMPGFIMTWVVGLFVPSRRMETSSTVLKLLSLSFLDFAVCFPLVAWILFGKYFQGDFVALTTAMATVGIIMPVILGLVIGVGGQRDWLGKALGRLKLNVIHPLPVSWDYVFGGRTDDTYIKVTLIDGTVRAGKYGPLSFAASYPDGNDLFLEALYEIDDGGTWTEHPTVEGIWIASGDIRCIEFMKPEPEEKENEQEDNRLRPPADEDRERSPAQGFDEGASAEGVRSHIKAAVG